MHKQEFLSRFQLKILAKSSCHYRHHLPLKTAAVLIVLIDNPESDTGLQVLLTKRAKHLKHHPAQISFPGGKVEPQDKNLIATALRESYEEIGLAPDSVSIIGQLPSYQVISGFQVTPIIAIVDASQSLQKNDNEVAEILQVPLAHFLQKSNHYYIRVLRGGSRHKIHFFPYKHHNIWGATAAMLKDLIEHVK